MKPKHRKPFKDRSKSRPPKRDKADYSKPRSPERDRETRDARPPALNRETFAKPNLYGMHAVREAWLNPARHVKALYVTEHAWKNFELSINTPPPDAAHLPSPHGEEGWEGGAKLKRPKPTILDKHAIDRLCPLSAVHQGIAMLADNLPEMYLQDLMIKASAKPYSIILMLDQVTDPHNVGAILRSAAAFNIDGVVMQRKHAPTLEGVLAKTACGAVEHMPVAHETNLSRALEELKDNGFFVYGLDEHGDRNIGEIKKGGKVVLVLGAEGDGLRRLIKEHCDALVRLPTSGPIASLNVSNAAAVALYALKA